MWTNFDTRIIQHMHVSHNIGIGRSFKITFTIYSLLTLIGFQIVFLGLILYTASWLIYI